MVKRNDRRYPFLTQAATHHPKHVPKAKGDTSSTDTKPSETPSVGHGGDAQPSQLVKDDGIRVGDSTAVKYPGMIPTRVTWRDQMKREITCLIDVLPPFVAKRARLEETDTTVVRVEERTEQIQGGKVIQQEQEPKGRIHRKTVVTKQQN